MFKCGGWKASLKFGTPSRRREVYENGPDLTLRGAYRAQGEEFYGRGSLDEPTKKLTPAMVKLPPSNDALKSSKSANDLTLPNNLPPQLRKSTPDVSTDPRGGILQNRDSSALHKNAKHSSSSKSKRDSKKQEKEQKAEKKRLAAEKKKEKLAAAEQAKQDKLRIQRDKQIAQQQAKDVKAKKEKEKGKNKTEQPVTLPQASVTKSLVSPVPQAPVPPQRQQSNNPLAKNYSTNTLESSISRSSGPPPYSEIPKPPEKHVNKKDSTGNTSFSKPIEDSSWDLISEHRSQIQRNAIAGRSNTRQVTMDLKFSFDQAQANDLRNNSEV